MNLIYFFGRFHVLALHLPIALILVVAVLEWMRRGGRRPDLEPALRLLWAASAITALATVCLGYMHFAEGGFTGSAAIAHRAFGTSVALICVLAWLMRRHESGVSRALRLPVSLVLVGLVSVTGHLGGDLTHGNTYLVEFAPNFLRRLAGLEPARPPVTSVAQADAYLDVLKPMFSDHCLSCHNADKRRGDLDLSTYAGLQKGGKDGPVVNPGDAAGSDLVRRVSLSPDQEEFMPKEGKPPLSSDQVAILRWWVTSGAKDGTKVGSLKVPAEIQPLLAVQLGLAKPGAGGSAAAGGRSMAALVRETLNRNDDPKNAPAGSIDLLEKSGFMARQVSRGDPRLIVSPIAPGMQLSMAQLNALASVPNVEIVELDVRHAGLGDEAIGPLSHLKKLARLRLDSNKFTDSALSYLGEFGKLEVLGLYGNAGVTDRGIDELAKLSSLKTVFVWQTGITNSGVKKLKLANRNITVVGPDESEGAPPETAQGQRPIEDARIISK